MDNGNFRGVAYRDGFLNNTFQSDPIYGALILANQSLIVPNQYEERANLYRWVCYLRSLNGTMVNQEKFRTLYVGETIGAYIDAGFYKDEVEANRIMETINEHWFNNRADLPLCEEMEAEAGPLVAWNADTAERIFRAFTRVPLDVVATTLELITAGIISFSKRGSCSENFIERTVVAIRAELGLTIRLQANVLMAINAQYGRFVIGNTAGPIFERLTQLIPQTATKIRTILAQTSWTGLTSFVTIKTAFQSFRDFNWNQVIVRIPADFVNYEEAMRVINNNPYFGYTPNLGGASATRYKNLAYVAKELLIKTHQEPRLRDYQGWTRNPPHKAALDALIDAYVNVADGVVPEPQADHVATLNRILEGLNAGGQ